MHDYRKFTNPASPAPRRRATPTTSPTWPRSCRPCAMWARTTWVSSAPGVLERLLAVGSVGEQHRHAEELGPRELHPEVGGEAEVGERLRHLRQAQFRVGGEAHLQAEERGDDPIDDGLGFGRFHGALPPTLQRFGALGGQPGVSTPNCLAYSAFNRCQPPNFIASPPTMRPMGVPLRRRSRTSKQVCHPAAPIEMKRRSMLCHSVRRVPPPKASSSHRVSLYSSTLGASARVTVVSSGVGVPIQVRFTVPTRTRLPSASKSA